MNDFELKFIYRHTHHANTVEPNHTHPCMELVYYLSGEGVSVIGGVEHEYKPNTFVFVSQKVVHLEKHKTQTEVLFFAFDFQLGNLIVNDGIYSDESGEIKRLFKAIEKEVKEKKPDFKFAMAINACRILLNISRRNQGKKEEDVLAECMKYAKEYIVQHIHSKIVLKDVAASIGYSYDYFRHQFFAFYGISVKEFVLKEKLKGVKLMLEKTDESIAKIAELYAFESANYLIMIFKKAEGCTPIEYRKRHKQEQTEVVHNASKILVDYEDG